MFLVLLRFSENKARAPELMAGHQSWIRQGFENGVFLLVGSLKLEGGGVILANGMSRSELEKRINEDPFVQEDVVRADIVEFLPNRADDRLKFVLAQEGAT
jgi:uncharacterized protein YciI